jgi:hypothetical protein
MTKSTTKGNGYEIEVRKYLESEGWTVFRQHRKPMFINGRMITVGADIFGCDMVAKLPANLTKWIQVSTVENKSAKEKQVCQFHWDPGHESLELWLRVKGKKVYRVFRWNGDSFIEDSTVVLRGEKHE